jgi:futalosine hydrolase
MNILVVCATEFEVKPLLDFLDINEPLPGLNESNKQLENHDVQVLITGVGMVNTAFMMGRYTNSIFDLAINVGVCGAFDRDIGLGQLVNITEDVLSEMGAENGDDFLTYDQLNLPGRVTFLANQQTKYPAIEVLKKAKGITVNTVHGKDISIEKVKQLFHPDVESMEGAAFFASCKRDGGDFIQVRAVSNYVEKRDKSKWQMSLAIKNLNDFLITFIKNV